jgi:hypothetical protein
LDEELPPRLLPLVAPRWLAPLDPPPLALPEGCRADCDVVTAVDCVTAAELATAL